MLVGETLTVVEEALVEEIRRLKKIIRCFKIIIIGICVASLFPLIKGVRLMLIWWGSDAVPDSGKPIIMVMFGLWLLSIVIAAIQISLHRYQKRM